MESTFKSIIRYLALKALISYNEMFRINEILNQPINNTNPIPLL